MTELTGQARARYVQAMFTQIAGRYDLMNRLMTGFQDVRWRRQVIRRAEIPANATVLDLGSGTGDLAREVLRLKPGTRVTAADFTLEMMRVGQKAGKLDFSATDALHLPFAGQCFDAVVSGFLMRNVVDLGAALAEQYRVLKEGGRIVILDTTRPKKNFLSPFIRLHMHFIIPTLGGLLTGVPEAYRYLPDTTEGFLSAEELERRMGDAGFRQTGFLRLMFGTIAIHWGVR